MSYETDVKLLAHLPDNDLQYVARNGTFPVNLLAKTDGSDDTAELVKPEPSTHLASAASHEIARRDQVKIAQEAAKPQ